MNEIKTSHTELFKVKPCILKTFEPQPDITAYELAQILPYMHGKALTQEDFDKLGTAARHLK